MFARLLSSSLAAALVACGGSPPPSTPVEGQPVALSEPAATQPETPVELAGDQGKLVGVEVDATHVYWLDFDTGRIRRMPLAGGDIETVVAGGLDALAEEMVVVGDWVYWTARSQDAILRAPASGGVPAVVAPNQVFATAIKADGHHVYWTADGHVRRMALSGGPIEDIDVGGSAGEHLGIDAEFLYVSGVEGAFIVRVDKRTLVFTQLGRDESALGASLAVFNEHVYFTASDDSIRRVPRRGGSIQVIAPARGGTYALAVGREGIYWGADSDNGMGSAIYRMPRDGEPIAVAAGYQSIGDIALSADSVYFVDQDGGTVNMMPRSFP